MPAGDGGEEAAEAGATARKLGVVAAALLELAERVGTETGLAAASLRAAAQDATTTSQRSVAQSVEQAGRAAAAAIGEAVGEPVRRAETALNANTARLDEAVRRLDGRLAALRRLHTGNSWIALAASALVIVVAVAVAVYAGAQVRDDLVQVGWVDDINAAIGAGRLARCPGGKGVCALVDGKWSRLSP